MKASRKDFERLARVLYLNRGEFYQNPRAFKSLCDEIASVLAGSNPAFNRTLFLNACVTGNKHDGSWRDAK